MELTRLDGGAVGTGCSGEECSGGCPCCRNCGTGSSVGCPADWTEFDRPCPAVTEVELDISSAGLNVPEALRTLQKIFKDKTEYIAVSGQLGAWRNLGGQYSHQYNCKKYGFNV